MDDQHRYFRLGLFVIVSVAMLLAVLFILGGRALLKPSAMFETYFDESVSGLGVGAPVQFRGVPLGQVTEIATTASVYEEDVPIEKRKSYIVVRVKITGDAAQVAQWRSEISAYVERGLRTQTRLAGVTGQQFLSLDFLDPAKIPPLPIDWRPDYPYIPSAPSLTGQIIGNFQKILGSLNEANIEGLLQNVSRLSGTLNQKAAQVPVAELAREAGDVLREARATMGHLDEVIEDAHVVEAMDTIGRVSRRLDELLARPAAGDALENAAAFTGRLRAIGDSGRIERIVKDLEQVTNRLDALIGDNQYDVNVIVQDLRVTAKNLRSISEKAKGYPAGLLIGGPPEEVEMPWEDARH